MSEYKIALLDIENAPNLGYTWEKWQQNVVKFEREWYMLSFAYKWLGQDSITCKALPDYKGFKSKPFDDTALVEDLWLVFEEADLVVAHNAVEFDVRKANTRYLLKDLAPPKPYTVADTLLTARKHFRFNDNSLGALAEALGVGEKLETGGIGLWIGCMAGDKESWAKMRRYNKHDITLLEGVYGKLRPWMKTHPNVSLGSGKSLACPVCGQTASVERRGWRNLKSWRAQSFVCNTGKGGCGKWSQGPREKIPGVILSA